MNIHICVHTYVRVYSLYYTQFNFHKLVCYVCKTFNSRIYHMCRIKCVKISHFLNNYTVNYMCMILRGPIAN